MSQLKKGSDMCMCQSLSWINSGNVPGSLESSLSLLSKYPSMNLQLSDFYRKDTREQSDATRSEKSSMAGPSKTIVIDTVKKLPDALNTETTKNILS